MKQAHRRLREATAHAHEAVDAVFGDYDLTDRDSYARFLSAHAAAMVPLEAALDVAGAEHVTADWGMRKRGDLILADLAALGSNRAQAEPVEAGWISTPFDKLRASAERGAGAEDLLPTLAGILYVVEGSRLGGKFLSRRLPAEFPKSYLDAHQPSGNWANLLASIDAILYDQGRTEIAVGAALSTFSMFERAGKDWLVKE
jgi:heme oxygenase (biliverdin-IX-beta and delta-forming)